MPSGPKKRKAAKKRKEKGASINSSTNSSQGEEDVRSQDGKSNGSGEFCASDHYDHCNCHNSLNGSNGELEKNYASSEFIPVEDQSLGIERKTINESGFGRNYVVEADVEKSSEKFYGRDDKSLISCSDDKPDATTDKNTEADTSFYKISSFDDKQDNSLATDAIQVNKFTAVIVANSVKSEETICRTRIAAVENTVVSDTVASRLEENVDTLLSNQGDGTRASISDPNSVPKQNEHKVLDLSGDSDKMSSDVMENGSKIYTSSATLFTDASKCDTIAKDSDIASRCKNQISASAPQVAQRTSLLSCCGLFDLLKLQDPRT